MRRTWSDLFADSRLESRTEVQDIGEYGTTPPKSSSSSPAAPASTPVVTPAPDLTSELLSLSDLPAGWSAVGSSDSGEPKCLDTVRSDLNAVSKAEATYVGGSSGVPDLEESLAYVPGKGQSDMLAVSRVLSGCGHVRGHKAARP